MIARFDNTMFSAETFTSLIKMIAAAIFVKDGEAHYGVADTAANVHDYEVRRAPVFTRSVERKKLVTMSGEVAHIKLVEPYLQLPQCNSWHYFLYFTALNFRVAIFKLQFIG